MSVSLALRAVSVPLIANFLIADEKNICVLAVSSANWPFSGLVISGTIYYKGFNFS